MSKSIYCLVNNHEQAQRIVDHLLAAGFSSEDISIVSPNRKQWVEEKAGKPGAPVRGAKRGTPVTERHTKAPEGGVTGATAGGLLGGSLGLLAGIGALSIPGLGPFIAAGPIMAALSGSAVGGSLGLLVGSLVGAGIPEYNAKQYEAGLREGEILISLNTDDANELNRANDIFKRDGAKDITTTREKVKSGY